MTDPTDNRELDAAILERVFGFERTPARWKGGVKWTRGERVYGQTSMPKYSTRIADAWKVVEKLADTPGPNGDHYTLSLWYSGVEAVAVFAEQEEWEARATAETAPLAICLAALAALKALAPTDKRGTDE